MQKIMNSFFKLKFPGTNNEQHDFYVTDVIKALIEHYQLTNQMLNDVLYYIGIRRLVQQPSFNDHMLPFVKGEHGPIAPLVWVEFERFGDTVIPTSAVENWPTQNLAHAKRQYLKRLLHELMAGSLEPKQPSVDLARRLQQDPQFKMLSEGQAYDWETTWQTYRPQAMHFWVINYYYVIEHRSDHRLVGIFKTALAADNYMTGRTHLSHYQIKIVPVIH